jgi:hypothetical protein
MELETLIVTDTLCLCFDAEICWNGWGLVV